jgi:hypothetical protein
VDSPLIVESADLAEVVESIAANISTILSSDQLPGDRVSYEDKNEDNNMTPQYAKEIRRRYLNSS